MREFFGFSGYRREAEGAMSWQHLVFVTALMAVMVLLAVWLGRRNKQASQRRKNRVLIWAALLIDGFEIFKIIILGFRSDSADWWTMVLPLFLCSIQLITIPLAAFTQGRIKEAALDFVSIFGLLGAVLGTYGATQNYSVYPVLSMDNVVSGITHSISGFTALYILIAGMASLKRENIWISFTVLLSFCAAAYLANILVDYNYMFLMRGDGTPYDLLYNLVDGNRVLYPLGVVVLFLLYIWGFYKIFYMARRKKALAV